MRVESYEFGRAFERLERWVGEHHSEEAHDGRPRLVDDVAAVLNLVRSGAGSTLPGLTLFDLFAIVQNAKYVSTTLDLPVTAQTEMAVDPVTGRPVWRIVGIGYEVDPGVDDDNAGIPSGEFVQGDSGYWEPAEPPAPGRD